MKQQKGFFFMKHRVHVFCQCKGL